MAVIAKIDVRIKEEYQKVPIKCNSQGIFRIDTPATLVIEMGAPKKIEGKTKEQVEKELKTWIREYAESNTTTQKVILYNIRITAEISDDSTILLSQNEISFARGMAMSLSAGVFEMTTVTFGEKKKVNYVPVRSSIPESLSVHRDDYANFYSAQQATPMEWTEEREKFFADLGRNYEDMILRVHNFLGDQTALVKLLESGGSLLLPTNPQEQ